MNYKILSVLFLIPLFALTGCSHMSHRTYSKTEVLVDEDPEPVYDITLDEDYQNFVEYAFSGNRSESFGTFFNKFYTAEEDFDEGIKEYQAGFIANYNPSLDSLNKLPPVSNSAKELFNKVIERCSKIIQYNKNTRFLDDAVLLIGKSYFFMQDYLQAERKFNEFLSKLTNSNIYDEAILYLGKTKLKLRNSSDGITILNNLLEKTQDDEIKSDITEELAIHSLSNRDISTSVEFFKKSIDFTKSKDKKAQKQYTLAKIYLLNNPSNAIDEYNKVIKNSSDFDLTFYAYLNKGIAQIKIGRYEEAQELLDDLSSDYRDYPELKQQADLELANTFFYLKKYDEALKRYYDIIIDFPGSKSSSEAYYYIAKYYEDIKKDYFNAVINYKKATQGPASETVSLSTVKYRNLDKYFSLMADINDTLKIFIPDENPELEKYRSKKLEEKGENKPGQYDPKLEPPKEGKGFGAGFKDTIEQQQDDGSIKKTIIDKSEKDSVITDSLTFQQTFMDPQHVEDSIKAAKNDKMFGAYFGMAELFVFSIGISDSAIKYLEYIVEGDTNTFRRPRAMYLLSTILRNNLETEKADALLKKIINDYPKTEIANESRKILGIQLVEIETDSAEILYKEAVELINSGDHKNATENLYEIFTNYPQSKVAPKAIFTLGWIYENIFKNFDSSYHYYRLLRDTYTFSQYSIAIEQKLELFGTHQKSLSSDSTNNITNSIKVIENESGLFPRDSVKELFEMPVDTSRLDPGLMEQLLKDTTAVIPVPQEEGDN